MDNWSLQLKGDCSSGSMIKIHEAIVEGWVGTEGSSVSNRTLDDTSSELGYSGVDWSTTTGLSAPFYDDSQHYTSVGGATMNITFSGSAIVVWSSVDNQHGPYAASLYYASTLVFSSDSTLSTTSYNPFLAVPVPFYFASGLDPTQTYTLCLQTKATNGTYLDVDYVEVYTSTGGGPPNGGTAALPSSGNGSTNMAAIIGGAVGGGVGLLLLLLIAWWLWRRRKTQIDRRNGGTQPLSMKNAASPIRHDVPVQLNRAVVPIPYGAHTPPQHDPYSAERQGLLYAPHAPGSPQVTANSYTTSSGYDPYASFGGNYPSPHSSSYTGLPAGAAAALDPVHARRQGKAAEIDAARERMRLANAGSTGALMSPSTTMSPNTSYTHHPPHPPASSLTQTMTGSQVPSWDAGSQAGQSTTAQTSTSANNNGMNVPLGDVKTPEDPPPSYEHP
ncbi:hypothetical protein M408DRAFT_332608 [Serendipita vermifera MAFF 305830]|uniref:Uncharacterized protein n=1 Tax=Serendipita vermifera MAFF 305830 TaxID=933852 RepID=A0A0C2X050_SERVB|nr:hypothetical protein M408DRAFT_332608 [Serendipita vermifera MAFF 305830]